MNIEYYRGIDSADERLKARTAAFRETFESPAGRLALTFILEDLGFYREAKNPEEAALKNYAAVLIGDRLGIRDTFGITEAILALKYEKG